MAEKFLIISLKNSAISKLYLKKQLLKVFRKKSIRRAADEDLQILDKQPYLSTVPAHLEGIDATHG